MNPKRFRTKVVEIEAIQFDGTIATSNRIAQWVGSAFDHDIVWSDKAYIQTLEGVMQVSKGDWIIKGLIGEFYPCKDNAFQQKYEEVE